MSSEYQLKLPSKTIETADPPARAVLEKAKAQVGFIPNMYGLMVNSPGLLDTYLDGYKRFREGAGLTPPEQEVVFLSISRYHGCDYCMAAHSMIADEMSKLAPAVTDAIRDGKTVPDAKLSALSEFTRIMLDTRGQPTRAEVENFIAAGYSEGHILEVILAIAVKTISNYSNHLFHTPVDDMFAYRAWTG